MNIFNYIYLELLYNITLFEGANLKDAQTQSL